VLLPILEYSVPVGSPTVPDPVRRAAPPLRRASHRAEGVGGGVGDGGRNGRGRRGKIGRKVVSVALWGGSPVSWLPQRRL